jgi:hypothetical protein
MLDSVILGRSSDFLNNDSNTEEEVSKDNLLLHDQRTLLDLIKDEEASKYEIKSLVSMINKDDPYFWELCLKELIHVYNLNTLKYFISPTQFTTDNIDGTIELLIYLKVTMIDILRDNDLPTTRHDWMGLYKKYPQSSYFSYSIETIDKYSMKKFNEKMVRIKNRKS